MLAHIRSFFTPPVFEDDEDKTHLAKLISYFAWAIFAGSVFFYFIWAITSPELVWRLVYGLPLFPLAGSIIFFLKRKKLKLASMILVVGIWAILFFSSIFNGGIHSPAMGGYIFVVLFAALLLGRRNAIGFAGLSVLATLGLVFAQNAGWISGEQFATPMAIWSSYTTYLIVSAMLLHLATSNIQEALSRARWQIDERKKTEEALREAEFRYRLLAEKIPVVTYRDAPDREASSLYISPQIETLVGYSPSAWLENPNFWQELLHPDDFERVMADVERLTHQKNRSAIEYRLGTKEGGWVWVRDESDVVMDENGQALYVQGTLSNITDRIRAEEALRSLEEKFEKAFRSSPTAMLISSPTRGYLEINDAFIKITGYSREESIGRFSTDVGLWLNREEHQQSIETISKVGFIRDIEVLFRKKEGEIGVALTSAELIELDGEPCILASLQDITERKRDEEALRISEEKFQKAFHFSPIAITISSPTRGYLAINDAFIQLTGYSRDETLGHFSSDLGLWKNREVHQAALQTIAQRGFLTNIEAKFQKKSGESGVALVSAVVIEFDNEQCILASLYDITDRLRNEAAIRASEEKFQKAFLSSPVSMMINSPARGILNVNRAFEELTGFQREDALGRHAHEIGLWVDMNEREASIDMVRQNGSLHDFEFRFRKKDGAIRTGSLAVDLVDIEGEICYLASFQDITARKEAENALRNMNAELENRVQKRTAQLEAANQELESFSYSVSHDLRTPLRAINGFSRLLIEGYQEQLPPEAQRLQNLVQENSLKMARLIDDLLAFSRLGRSPIQMRQLQLKDLVTEVWNDLAHDRVNRFIELSLRDLEPCEADPSLLKQVFANLLGNAIKFTRPRELARIEVGNQIIDGQNVYYVKDNGAGFDMAYADKLFGVFQRLHHESEFEGTGVGLAIVQRIIHRHGGRIWAEAIPEQGTTFFFTLSDTKA